MKDRNRLRNHIRAAREWLGQADSSLEQEKDIQGDLKLMLARAELQRANETRASVQGRLRRIAPLATAIFVAAAGLGWMAHEGMTGRAEVQKAATVEIRPEAEQDLLPEPPAAGLEAEIQEPLYVLEEIRPTEGSAVQDPPAVLPEVAPVQEEIREEPAGARHGEADVSQAPSVIPSTEMQKLMQSAGKVLRAD